MKKLIAGNWKMNPDKQGAESLVNDLQSVNVDTTDILVCPPYIYLQNVANALDIPVGAQDCSRFENGAYTGDISASMVKEAGCEYVILGHSERRQNFDDTSEVVQQKAVQALKAGLTTIICVGETDEEREANKHEEVVKTQILQSIPQGATADNLVIAYEPVWAIGTGKTASTEDIKSMHAFIRSIIGQRVAEPEKVRILYGGSVKPDNAKEILYTKNVDGALIGGASLDAKSFLQIIEYAKV